MVCDVCEEHVFLFRRLQIKEDHFVLSHSTVSESEPNQSFGHGSRLLLGDRHRVQTRNVLYLRDHSIHSASPNRNY